MSVDLSRMGAVAGVMIVLAFGASSHVTAQKPGAGPDTGHAAHHPARPDSNAAASGAAAEHEHMQMHEQMTELHMRMMADSAIHARVMADSSMHGLMQQMMQHMTPEHHQKMEGMMEHMSPEQRARMKQMMEHMSGGHGQHGEQPPASGHRHPGT